ncbi:MAG TPA: O-antigen ligase family protein [Roseateles sp.]
MKSLSCSSLPASAALVAAVAYLALAPLLLPTASAHDGGRILQVGLLAAVALLALPSNWVARNATLPISLKVCAFACLALTVPSVLTAQHVAAAAQEAALLLGLAGLAVLACRAARAGPVTWVFDALLAGSCAYFLLTTGIYAAALSDGAPLNARLLHLGFDNPRFFNHVQTLALPVLLGWSMAAPGRLQRRAALVVASFHFAWLFMDLARASLLALAVATLWCFWTGASTLWRRLLLCALAGFALNMILFVALPAALERHWVTHFASAKELTSSHSRDMLLSAALELTRSHPWLGAGPMQFAALVHPKGAHPHNLYLQWASEFGLPSLLLLLSLLLAPLWRVSALLRRQVDSPPMTAALGAAWLAALVDAGFSGNFVMPLSQVWIAIVYGLLLGSLPAPAASVTSAPALRRGALVLLLASQAWLCAEAWRQWQYDPARISDTSPVATVEQSPRPRFWQQGWL